MNGTSSNKASDHAHAMTRMEELGLAAITGITVANAYYIHPIISRIAQDFAVDSGTIGLVPALNQIALAAGILFILPLGDRFGNRTLCLIFSACQTLTLIAMAMATQYTIFLIASTLLGFFTITPYLLPAYASKRVPAKRLGHMTATLTAGIIVGILLARTGAGIITEYGHWRYVYWLAAGSMAAVTLAIPFIMEGRREPRQEDFSAVKYATLIWSVFALLNRYREVILSGLIQALNFGIFLSVWLGLALHLTSDSMGYGVDIVGYLAAFSAVSIFVTPRIGRWADRVGPRRARLKLTLVQMGAVLLLWPFGNSLALLLIPLFITNLVGPSIDVTSRMTFLSLEPSVRTRLMTAFIFIMFIGGGIASWAGTAAYSVAFWPGSAALALLLSVNAVLLSYLAVRSNRH